MKPVAKSHTTSASLRFKASFGLALAFWMKASLAFAQASPAGEAPPPEQATPPAQPAAPSGTGANATAATSGALRPVEPLPPSAYPNGRGRGLQGGSLWSEHDFHGLQWPYYPKTGIGVSGYVWVDTGLEQLAPGQSLKGSSGVQGSVKSSLLVQQARLILRTTPTWSDGTYFVQGQGELVATKLSTSSNGIVWSADDVWLRAGRWNLFDLQLGRYEAWEVYHLGMGFDPYTLERNGPTGGPIPPVDFYGLTYLFYRQDSIGQGAIHFYPTDWLRFEAGAQYGPELNGTNTLGIRPVAVADFGWLKLKAGAEFRDQTGQGEGAKNEIRQQGAGGGVELIVDPYVEFGVNGAYSTTDTRDSQGRIDSAGTSHTYSVGGFANGRAIENLLVGAGVDYTFKEDSNFDGTLGRNDFFDLWQAFGAVQYVLFKELFIKAVFAYALADQNPIPMVNSTVYKNEMFSGRVRALYLF